MRASIWQVGLAFMSAWLFAQPSNCLGEGSIAFSQESSGRSYVGGAYNHPTQQAASADALQRCRKAGTNCIEIAANFGGTCVALALQVGNNGYAVGYHAQIAQARNEALRTCSRMGTRCYIEASFCDTFKEVAKTLICTHPVFTEERRLLSTFDGTRARAESIGAAIAYLYQRYCRDIEEELVIDGRIHVGDNCTQYSGMFRGETVYWGSCSE
jgi:hypothetical protein